MAKLGDFTPGYAIAVTGLRNEPVQEASQYGNDFFKAFNFVGCSHYTDAKVCLPLISLYPLSYWISILHVLSYNTTHYFRLLIG